MTVHLIAHGAYWKEGNQFALSLPFKMEDDAFLAWAKERLVALPGELIEAIHHKGVWGRLKIQFFAWEHHRESIDYSLGWFDRVKRLIEDADQYFGTAQGAKAALLLNPIIMPNFTLPQRPTAAEPKYTLTQCWYAKEVEGEAKRKAFAEATMAAVREFGRGQS